MFSKCPFVLRFSHQNHVCTPTLPDTCHMPCPSQFYWFDYPNNICIWVQKMNPPQYSNPLQWPVTFFHLRPNVFLSTPLFKIITLCSSFNVKNQSHPYQTERQNFSAGYFNTRILGRLQPGGMSVNRMRKATFRYSLQESLMLSTPLC